MLTAALALAMGGTLFASALYSRAASVESASRIEKSMPRAVSLAVPAAVIRKIDPPEALLLNASMPVSSELSPPAAPFLLKGRSPLDRARSLECLAGAIYYEAATESTDGQRAVAQVVMNRVRHMAFPKTICGVVFQGSERSTGCQFSFTCDGSLARSANAQGWRRAWEVADQALSGVVFAPVGLGTHYHANYVVPYWASSLAKNAVIGTHIFYRWPGEWGRARSFRQDYFGGEPDPAQLKRAALQADMRWATLRGRAGLNTTLAADAALEGQESSAAQQAVAVDIRLAVARATLGPKHPRMIDLQKQDLVFARNARASRSAQLAAVEGQLKAAGRTLGPKHPEMQALQKQRYALTVVAN